MDNETVKIFEPKPQPGKKGPRPLIALQTCTVTLPSCDCEYKLIEGREVHGLKREDRDHLKFHGFIG